MTLQNLATPALMAMELSEGLWQPAKHLLYIDRIVNRAINGFGPRIIVIQSPPRHGKSEYGSKWTPSNFLTRFPDRRAILTSYEATFAASWGRKIRNTIDENSDRLGIRVASDKSAANDWSIEGREGGLITAGAGGPLTGRGADLLILDDLIKNHEEALSSTVRESRWEWYQSTASTRVEPGGLTIFIGTRWHEDDPPGRALAAAEAGGEPVTLIDLPAIAEENDCLGREVGEALWPQRWNVEHMLRRKAAVSPYWWGSLYQQRPGRHGSNEWPDYYFENILVPYMPTIGSCPLGSIAIDPSKGRERGDFSAIVYLTLFEGTLYVDATVRRRPTEQIVADGIDCAIKYGNCMHAFGVEVNQFQELLVGEFNRQISERNLPPLPLNTIDNRVNKKLRISRLGPYLCQGKLKFLDTPDNRLLIEQLKSFSMKDQKGVHDDGPDALEMAIRILIELSGGTVQDDGFGNLLTDMTG